MAFSSRAWVWGICCRIGTPFAIAAYMWIFGVALKSAGAAAFVLDYFLRESPAAFSSSPRAMPRSPRLRSCALVRAD